VSPFVLIDLIGSAGVGRSDAAGAIIPQFCFSLARTSRSTMTITYTFVIELKTHI
jgi:hypothetical protein